MNQMGYDAANIGNHDSTTDWIFASFAQGAVFPYVNANGLGRRQAGQRRPAGVHAPCGAQSRVLKDTQGHAPHQKVGVLGLVPPQIMQWDRGNLDGKVMARDMVVAARHYVPQMRAEGADLIIAIPIRVLTRYPVALWPRTRSVR